jgi:hypothetical protein
MADERPWLINRQEVRVLVQNPHAQFVGID